MTFPVCRTQKCRIKGTVVGIRTRIGDNAVVEDSVIMGSDTYDHVSKLLKHLYDLTIVLKGFKISPN